VVAHGAVDIQLILGLCTVYYVAARQASAPMQELLQSRQALTGLYGQAGHLERLPPGEKLEQVDLERVQERGAAQRRTHALRLSAARLLQNRRGFSAASCNRLQQRRHAAAPCGQSRQASTVRAPRECSGCSTKVHAEVARVHF